MRPLRRRPHTQLNQHTIAELAIVRQMNTRYRHEGVGSSIRRVVNGDILVHHRGKTARLSVATDETESTFIIVALER